MDFDLLFCIWIIWNIYGNLFPAPVPIIFFHYVHELNEDSRIYSKKSMNPNGNQSLRLLAYGE